MTRSIPPAHKRSNSNKKSASDYEVGFGRPPREQQFGSKSRTGAVNTKGRPKKAAKTPTLNDALTEKVLVTERGRARRLTVRELIHKRLVRNALDGDIRAIKLVLDYDILRTDSEAEPNLFGLDPELVRHMLEETDKEFADRAPKTAADDDRVRDEDG